MDNINEIVRIITESSGVYSVDRVYSDWVESCALALQNSCHPVCDLIYKKREEQYIGIMKKYDFGMAGVFSKLFAMLCHAYEDKPRDILGEIYMKLGCGSKMTGQFFTPFHISEMVATMSVGSEIKDKIILNEPSCGSGSFIIAVAEELMRRGMEYQTCMKVVAYDLDWRSVYMTYVQCSILGIDAKVVQRNSLSDEKITPEQTFFTPRNMGVIV